MKRRICIIGYSGSGKSTLAQKLGAGYQCEVLHLDRVHWLPGWKERESAEEKKMLSEFMDTYDGWIIDGNYQSICYDRRLEEATQILFLNFPARICLYRAVKRYFSYRGKSRDSMTEGCPEKIDREFFWWILHQGRDRQHRAHYENVCEKYAEKMVVLKNPKAVRLFLKRCFGEAQ